MKAYWLVLAALPLGGCMTSGTNMHGDFACRAPNGTCAPMSSIDATAIASMVGSTQPIAGGEISRVPHGGRVVAAAAGGVPARTSDRVLQIVFPAHIDPSGIYHDAATAHVVVEPSEWTDSLTGRPSSPVTTAAKTTPTTASDGDGALASLDEVIAARGAQAVTAKRGPVTPAPASVPSVEGMTPASWSRDPAALNLREAAAGANGGITPDLDGSNFDTPDVVAAIGPAGTAAGADASPRFKTVRWHGHKVRVPLKGAGAVGAGASPAAPSTRTLNLAALDRSSNATAVPAAASGTASTDRFDDSQTASISTSAPVAVAGYSTRPVLGSSIAPSTVAPPPVTIAPTVTAAPPAGLAVAPPPTKSADVAAARVRAMAAPVIARGVSSGRADAAAEATSDANPFTALVAAGAAGGSGGGTGQILEPQP